MSATSVKVAVRVRPMAAKELLANSTDCISYIPGTQQIIVGGHASNSLGLETTSTANSSGFPNLPSFTSSLYAATQKSFTFDYVYDPSTSQNHVYEDSIKPLVDRFMEGFHATILAYGQVNLV